MRESIIVCEPGSVPTDTGLALFSGDFNFRFLVLLYSYDTNNLGAQTTNFFYNCSNFIRFSIRIFNNFSQLK
jgi:hypothetical protein